MKVLTLLARCCFLICLVLAFLNLRESVTTDNKFDYNILYLDTSPSLGQSGDISSNLYSLKKLLATSVNSFPAHSRFKLITNDFQNDANRMLSKAEVVNKIIDAKSATSSRSFNEISQRFESNFDHLIFASDFQHSMFEASNDFVTRSSKACTLIKPTYVDFSNVYVDTCYLSNSFLVDNLSNELIIKFKNSGRDNFKGLVVKTYLNDQAISTTTLDINSGESKSLTIQLNQVYNQFNNGIIKLSDGEVDFDNNHYFSLNKRAPLQITEIYEARQRFKAISAVFGNKDFFNQSSFNVDNIDFSQLAQSDLIILNGVINLNDNIVSILRERASAGTNIFVFPTKNEDLSWIEKLSGVLIRKSMANNDTLRVTKLDKALLDNVITTSSGNIDLPYSVPLFEPTNYRKGYFSLGFGKSMVYELTKNIFLLGTQPTEEFTNFHLHALFVPYMYKTVFANGTEVREPLYYSLEKTNISKAINDSVAKKLYQLENIETGLTVIPDQNKVSGRSLNLSFSKGLVIPGSYSLKANDIEYGRLAFNFEKPESQMSFLSDEQAIEYFQELGFSTTIYNTNEEDKLVRQINDEVDGKTYWKLFIVLALCFLLVEIGIIRFWKK